MPRRSRRWLKKVKVCLYRSKQAFTNFTKSVSYLWKRWLPLRFFQLRQALTTPVRLPKPPKRLPLWAVIILVACLLALLAWFLAPRPLAHSNYTMFRSLPLPVVTEEDKIEVGKLEWNTTTTPKGICPVLSLSYPNKTGIITRGFTSFGSRSFWHTGIDWTTKVIDVYSSSVGEVVFSGWEGEYGLVVFVDIPGTGYQLRYAHLSQTYVLPGQEVVVGEAIGVAGETGNATGVHLHQSLLCDGGEIDFLKYFK